jgi:putative Holliday junction resolvase
VDELVIGYPIHMDGAVGKRAKEVDIFISELMEKINLPVHRVDERLTSVAAAESIQRKPKGKRGKRPPDGRIDATAASLILRDFLEGKGI